MKKKNGKIAFGFIATALALAIVMTIGCKPQVATAKTTYTVTFNANGGIGGPIAQSVSQGEKIAEPSGDKRPVRAGYTFDGWYKDAVGNQIWNFGADTVHSGITLYAKWQAAWDTKYTVKHLQEALDGSYVEVEVDRQTRTGITGKNTAATAKNYAGFIKSGDVDQVPIAADGSTVIEIRYSRKDITLTFHLAGGAIEGKSASITVIGKYGAPVEKKFADLSKVGYTFSVWNPVLPETFPAEDSVYTAQWAKEGEYRLAYKLNGGRNNGGNPASYNIETETIVLKDATRTGYTFAGWFNNEACEGEAVTQIAQGSTGDKTFWAKWEANSYTVRFEGNEAESGDMNAQVFTYDSEQPLTKNTFTRIGYTFSGWAKTSDASTRVFKDEQSVKNLSIELNDTVTLYAVWKANKYKIIYKLNGGRNNGSNPASYNPETEIPLNGATRTGYTFAGWFDNEACEGEAVTQIAQGSTEDKTFWAKWEPNSYMVRFDADGGLPVPQTQSVSYDNKANEPLAPVKEGYDFVGWYNAKKNTRWNFAANTVTADVELYAKWQEKTCDVTFTVDGGNGELKAYLKDDGSEIISGRGIGCGKTVLFEAKPDAKFEVDTWTVTGGELIAGTGTDGSRTAKVKITAETTVKVTFRHEYVQVAFANLGTYLNKTASATEVNYIEVIGLTPGYLKGNVSSSSKNPSSLGYVLKSNSSRKVALKLEAALSLTDMSYCFYNCESLVQVLGIPNSVQNMSYCFCGCKSLEQTSEIPDSVQNMSYCFTGCENLINAPKIPSSVQNMSYCFDSCKSSRNTPVISDNVTDMSFCFRSCASLRNVSVVGKNVQNMIGCFYNCHSLVNAPEIPDSVTNMQSCFSGCYSLRNAPAIGKNVQDMRACFYSCQSLMNVPEIPDRVTDMYECFNGCTNLTTVPVIPSSVTIMSACFNNCTSLTSVTLKCNYQSSFNNAFAGCTSLKAGSIKVPKNQLSTYTSHSSSMGAQSNWFVADE